MLGEEQEDTLEPPRQLGSPEILALGKDNKITKLTHQGAQEQEQVSGAVDL